MNDFFWDYQLTVLEKENWSYTLYKVNGKLLISAFAGGVALFEFNVVLNDVEQKEYAAKGLPFIKNMVKEINKNVKKYTGRNIQIKGSKK